MTSTRLPGKVLADLEGRPVLERELRRLARSGVDEVVVATTENLEDDPVVELASACSVRCVRGSEHDVLSRYVLAAHATGADVIVRVTADCPLLDPEVVDRVLGALGDADYASNVLERTFPRGLDVEALSRGALERVAELATSAEAREHVTWFVREERPDLFDARSVLDDEDNSDLQWTIDTAADLERMRTLYRELDLDGDDVPYREIVAAVRERPELAA
jgi:spore coat polysaccharide biosynthesis protein SpsF